MGTRAICLCHNLLILVCNPIIYENKLSEYFYDRLRKNGYLVKVKSFEEIQCEKHLFYFPKEKFKYITFERLWMINSYLVLKTKKYNLNPNFKFETNS